MNMLKTILPIATAIVLTGAAPAAAQTVGMATSSPGTFYHTQGTVLSGLAAEKGGLQVRVQPFTSPNIFLPALNAGEFEFGLANVYEVLLALEGRDFYQGRKNPNLRLVSTTSPLRVAYFVRNDSPIKTYADLKGKRIPWGYAQQKIIQNLNAAHFDAVGLKESDIQPVPVPSVARGADDFLTGRVDTFFFALGSGKVTEVDASVGGIRALHLPDTEQTRASFRKHYPVAYVRVEKPAKGIAGIAEPTPLMAYDGIMATHAKAPEETVYKMTKVLYENAADIAKSSGALNLFTREAMAKDTAPVEYHPGAIKFYKEKGVWPPKKK